ncbi:MAG: sugar ABC transporter permease, partial [Pseudomonadota bacterium]
MDLTPFLVEGWLAFFTIAFAENWVGTSIFAIVILAGHFARSNDPIEVAKEESCSNWQVFRHITLP